MYKNACNLCTESCFSTGSLPSSDRLTINKIYDLDLKLSGVEYFIADAVVADSGTYECQASNVHGSATKQVTIDVMAGLPPGVVSG